MQNDDALVRTFLPISELSIQPFEFNPTRRITSSDFTSSSVAILDAVHSKSLVLGRSHTNQYSTSSIYDTSINTAWWAIRRHGAKFASGSLLSIPIGLIGDGIVPGSIAITKSTATFSDVKVNDSIGTIIHNELPSPWQPNKLVGYYSNDVDLHVVNKRFSGKVIDQSVIGNHAQALNTVTLGSFPLQGSLTKTAGFQFGFMGNSYVRIKNHEDQNPHPSDDFAISAWVTVPSQSLAIGVASKFIISKRRQSSELRGNARTGLTTITDVIESRPNWPYELGYMPVVGKLYASTSDGTTTWTITSSALVNDGLARHVCISRESNDFTFWVSGSSQGTRQISTKSTYNEADIFLGTYDTTLGASAFSGSIDEFRIYLGTTPVQSDIDQFNTILHTACETHQQKEVGFVLYKEGLVVICDPRDTYKYFFTGDQTFNPNASPWSVEYKSTHPVNEYSIICDIPPGDLNMSTNPSLRVDGNEFNPNLQGFATSSLFSPYFTTIGLFNDRRELLAIAKMASPIQVPKKINLSVNVRFDIDWKGA